MLLLLLVVYIKACSLHQDVFFCFAVFSLERCEEALGWPVVVDLQSLQCASAPQVTRPSLLLHLNKVYVGGFAHSSSIDGQGVLR